MRASCDIATSARLYREEYWAAYQRDITTTTERDLFLRMPKWLDDELRQLADEWNLSRQEVIRALIFRAGGQRR